MILNVTLSYDSFAKFFSWITTIMEELSSMCCPSVQFCLAALFFFFFFWFTGNVTSIFYTCDKESLLSFSLDSLICCLDITQIIVQFMYAIAL